MFRVELGLTLQMSSGKGFNYFRPLIGIDGIDPDGDVDAQIERAIAGIKRAWPLLESALITIVDEAEVTEKQSILVELKKEMQEFNDRLIQLEPIKANLQLEKKSARRKGTPSQGD